MNILLVILAGLLSINANAEEATTVQVAPTQSQSSISISAASSLIKTPKWNFIIGGSQYVENKYIDGSGISFGIEKTIGQHFALGVGQAFYNAEAEAQGRGATSNWNVNVSNGYISFIPIQFAEKRMHFSAAAQVGATYSEFGSTDMYYGAGLEIGYNNQIGLRIDRKMSEEFASINSISLVGYY